MFWLMGGNGKGGVEVRAGFAGVRWYRRVSGGDGVHMVYA